MKSKRARALGAGVLLLLLLGSLTAFGDVAQINAQAGTRYQALRLTPAVYGRANPDLSDLRILDNQGQQVPYFVHNYSMREQQVARKYPMEVLDRFQKEEQIYVDLGLREPLPPNVDLQATSLLLSLPQSVVFAGEISLQGSHDGVTWEQAGGDTLYQVDGNQKLSFNFAKAHKYIYYRLGFSDKMEQLSITQATLQDDQLTMLKSSFVERLQTVYTVEQQDKETVVTVQGVKNLRLASVSLATQSSFRRQVSAMGQRDTLYNLAFGDIAYNDLTLELGGRQCYEDTVELRIQNHDDKPIAIEEITVEYYADELVFETGQGYTLEFGAAPSKVAPVYDIASYSNQVLEEGSIGKATLASITAEAPPPPEPEHDGSQIFTWVLVGVTALLLVVILLRLKKVKPENKI